MAQLAVQVKADASVKAKLDELGEPYKYCDTKTFNGEPMSNDAAVLQQTLVETEEAGTTLDEMVGTKKWGEENLVYTETDIKPFKTLLTEADKCLKAKLDELGQPYVAKVFTGEGDQ